MLSYRSRSRQEIVSDLCGKGFSVDVVNGVISELEQKGLVCDDMLARDIVTGGQRSSKSRSRIYADLRKRGIEKSTIDESLCSCFCEEQECEAAVRLMGKMLLTGNTFPTDSDIERAARRLSSRGFSPPAIAYALNHAASNAKAADESRFLDTDNKLS